MDPVSGPGAAGGIIPRGAPRSPGMRGFALPGQAAPPTAPAIAEIGLVGLLAVQEAGAEAVADREARRRGLDLLAELRALQRDLLRGAPAAERLRLLDALTDHVPRAADPGLADTVAEIVLRARIELIRYGHATHNR